MRCKICDSMINKPVWNEELGDWEVCTVCLEIINNVFEDPVIDTSDKVDDDLELDNLPE